MRTLYRWVAPFALASVFTIMIASHVAASCNNLTIGRYGVILTCTVTGEDENYCYYECTCDGDWAQCDDIIGEEELEDIN
ncbi:MAG: hypothetical protein MN733_32030 [Nitrososphaera sp.]|nr:hypothetical protein [Nitrososphaera sp.]